MLLYHVNQLLLYQLYSFFVHKNKKIQCDITIVVLTLHYMRVDYLVYANYNINKKLEESLDNAKVSARQP